MIDDFVPASPELLWGLDLGLGCDTFNVQHNIAISTNNFLPELEFPHNF